MLLLAAYKSKTTADIILRDRDEKVPVIIDDRLIEWALANMREYKAIQMMQA